VNNYPTIFARHELLESFENAKHGIDGSNMNSARRKPDGWSINIGSSELLLQRKKRYGNVIT